MTGDTNIKFSPDCIEIKALLENNASGTVKRVDRISVSWQTEEKFDGGL